MSAYSINAANVRVSSSATTDTVLAGQDILAGRPVYLNTTVSQWLLANALISNAPGGIAACSANTNQYFQIVRRDPNFQPGYSIAAGAVAVLGNAAGQINPVADAASPWYLHVIGVGIGNNNINLSFVGSNTAT